MGGGNISRGGVEGAREWMEEGYETVGLVDEGKKREDGNEG